MQPRPAQDENTLRGVLGQAPIDSACHQFVTANCSQFDLLCWLPIFILSPTQSELPTVSIYIDSHLVGQPGSRRAYKCLIKGNPGADVRALYRYVRSECYTLVSRVYEETYELQLNWDCFQKEDHKMDELRQQRLRAIDVLCDIFHITVVA